MPRTPLAVAILMLAVAAAAPGAQDAPTPVLRFDVASVKPNNSGEQPPRNLSLIPGGVRVTNLPLSTVLWMAHRVQSDQVVDVPSWARTESFDIVGRAPAGVPVNVDTIFAMMLDLFAERFQLETRREMRELPVYTLIPVKPGGPLGSRLKQAGSECQITSPAGVSAPPPPALARCGATARPGSISVHGLPLTTLTRLVGPMVGRVVVDRTGLSGNWDADLEFAPESVSSASGALPLAPSGPATDAPSLFTAIQEQLGLKLESTRAPVEVIVIERLERPTPD
jgi:uncharacterized protein (TIGR03435 family)